MFEIYAYQNSESLAGIFNAIAAIMGAGNYSSAIAIAVVFGFVVAMLAQALSPEKMDGWKWLAGVVLVSSILMVPKVTVGIVDKTGGTPVRVVANVPFGAAIFGSMTSQVGNMLTEMFETAFQRLPGSAALPAELAYQQNGMMFGARMVKYTRNVVFLSPQFRTDLIAFIDNCTKYDLLDGTLDPAAFATSDNVWALMATPNPARLTSISTGPGASTVVTCDTAYPILNAQAIAQAGLIRGKLAGQLNPTLTQAAALAAVDTQIQAAYIKNQIANAAATASGIILQNAMINALNDTSQIAGQRINDPASLLLGMGRAQALAQVNASWMNFGKVAEEALPLIRNTIEAICYALFPFVVLLLFLTSGRSTLLALKSYVITLLWIQLWPPIYAVLNYMASLAAASQLAAAADVGGTKALSIMSASSIYSGAVSMEAVVGYMVMAIPAIAWAAIKGMETIGQAAITGTSSLQGSVGSASGAAALGNVGQGNVSMDQVFLAPNRTSAFMRSWQDANGTTHRESSLTGIHAQSILRNEGFGSRQVSTRVSARDVQSANKAAEAALGESVSANTTLAATWADAYSKGRARRHSLQHSTGTTNTGFEEVGRDLSELDEIARGVSDRTGVSQQQAAQTTFKAGLGLFAGGNGAGSDASKNWSQGLSREDAAVLNQLTKEEISKFKRFGDRVARDTAYRDALTSDDREASDLSARLASATSRATQADAAYRETTRYAEEISAAHERGDTISFDLLQDPHNRAMFEKYTREYGRDSQAAFIFMDAELARQALRPIPFSDASAVPTSFKDVRSIHGQDAQNAQVNPPIVEQHLADQSAASNGEWPSAVSSQAGGVSPNIHPFAAAGRSARSAAQAPRPPGETLGTLRQDLQDAGDRIKNQTRPAEGKFYADHGIVHNPETGQVFTTQSQLDAVRNAQSQDMWLGFTNMADLLKDSFRSDGDKK